MNGTNNILEMDPRIEARIKKNPLLNLDTFIIPSPYVRDTGIHKDYNHSYVWVEEREVLGYLLVYSDEQQKNFHIYKIVVSPFGRGRGIGQAFINHLAANVPDFADIYLYIWEKQADTLEFFKERGFKLGQSIVYRNLVYYHVKSTKTQLLEANISNTTSLPEPAEIGKTRHDARKLVRLLSHMVDSLSAENCDKIVEDINRETTTMINMLNSFRDSRRIMHEVNLRDLILERIVPFVQASPIKCCLQIKLNTKNAVVLGYHENIGRAIINIISNSLDAIEEKGIKGFIKISLAERSEEIILSIRDNGIGIDKKLMKTDDEGYPAFVGNTTKLRKAGEGLGTMQIYSTFGVENIDVRSSAEGTGWKIRFSQSHLEIDQQFVKMQRRFSEFKDLWEKFDLEGQLSRTDLTTYIWQLRKMEIFLFDLILMFSNNNNIRTIYRTILGYIYGNGSKSSIKKFIFSLNSEQSLLEEWLYGITAEIRLRKDRYEKSLPDVESFRGALLKSYGQSIENVIIFTLDPQTGNFLAADRKLAEHLDFVQYLDKPRNELVRGEFTGDVNNSSKPIALGVWSIESMEDLLTKLKLLRDAAAKMIEIGVHKDKHLAFYQTTYPNYIRDIDSDKSTTFGRFAELTDSQLLNFTREAESNDFDFLMQVD